MKELDKIYEAKNYEDKIYKNWEDSGFFNPDNSPQWAKDLEDKNRGKFSMVLPPPNRTGILHMGHAAMLAIQDSMVRYHRMKGDKTLWVPGTDHAAIATQTKVEKVLIESGMKDPRKELGKEKFLTEVRDFAQKSRDTIIGQCKKMGASMDWDREVFTLDEKRSVAVRIVFKKMYDDGLIVQGHRIVNWCPRCNSTLADDEVEHREQSAKIYTFKYSADFPFSIATTRPETKLGDVAVAVNPKDDRYKKYIGKVFEIKSFAGGADLKINIVADKSVDIDYGTGAVGITPAHSHTDYGMAKKNDLLIIKIIDEDGLMTENAGKEYEGLNTKDARKKVVNYLRENSLLEKEEDALNNLSICYRCSSAIEPLPSKQWFVSVNKKFKMGESKIEGISSGQEVTLKELMQVVINKKQIDIIPQKFEKTYFSWVDNLNDWCISRQIWYGHQIPVWYRGDEVYVDTKAPEGDGWVQDQDTLDTWFSSGLWTFSALGWPEETPDFKNFHPTTILETGYDIIFFWVARMILMTTYTLGEIPFETVYLHGLVRDEKGKKMSKSLGNAIDPLDMIEQYGADATRLSLLIGNTPGNDLKLSEQKIAGFRNFTNKLWNISRFMLLNIDNPKVNITKPEAKTDADAWILGNLERIIASTIYHIEKNDLSYAGEKLREFTWNTLADWYLECVKIEKGKDNILNYVLNTVLKLWHPFMPFATEAIWREIYGEDQMLMVEKFPESAISYIKIKKLDIEKQAESTSSMIDDVEGHDAIRKFSPVIILTSRIRKFRAENKIEPSKKIKVLISAEGQKELFENNKHLITGLKTNIENLEIKEKAENPGGWSSIIADKITAALTKESIDIFVDLSGAIDKDIEKDNLQKELLKVEPYAVGLKKKLSNKNFVENAQKEVVENERQKLKQAEEKIEKINEQLKNI